MTKAMTTPYQMWIEERRNILLEVMSEHPHKEWTVREVQEAMREHPIVKANQPSYGKSTANTDLAAIRGNIMSRRAEVSDIVLAQQLTVTDKIIVDMMEAWNQAVSELNSPVQVDAPEDSQNAVELMIEQVKNGRVKRLDTIAKILDRAMNKQGRILPIEVAKKVDLSSGGITLANFMALRQKAGIQEIAKPALMEPNRDEEIIDGEFAE